MPPFKEKLIESIKLLVTNRANPNVLINEITQNGTLLGAKVPDCSNCGCASLAIAHGYGVVLEEGEQICVACSGNKGRHEITSTGENEFSADWVECEACKGEGKVKNE